MKIIVASQSAIKVKAAQVVFPDAEIVGCAAESGVSD